MATNGVRATDFAMLNFTIIIMIQTVILDFDGTMADTRSIILKTMRQTIESIHMPQPSDEECTSTIGMPLARAFEHLLHVSAEEGERCAEIYRRFFEQNNKPDAVELYDDVADTIELFSRCGITFTIASSRGHKSLEEYVERFNLSPYIRLIVGADDVSKAKPDPEPVLLTLEKLHADPATTIVVGDTHYDMKMAIDAGVRACGATYGYGEEFSLRSAGADYLISSFSSLAELIGEENYLAPSDDHRMFY